MPSFDDVLASDTRLAVPTSAERAVLAWRRITDRPTPLVIRRAGTNLPAQTVRVEYKPFTARQELSSNNTAGVGTVIIFGVREHPNVLVDDTDMQRGDRMDFNNQTFEVTEIAFYPGEIQAICEARSG